MPPKKCVMARQRRMPFGNSSTSGNTDAPVVVNPEPELREIAVERGWPIVETSSVPRVKLSSARGLTRMATNLVAALGRRALPA